MNVATKSLAEWKRNERLRFLAVGAYNTFFGIVCFWLFQELIPSLHYLISLILVSELSVLNAFAGHRYVVFKSKAPMFPELGRFHLVYASSMLLGITLTIALVELLRFKPTWANVVSVIATVVISYIAHKKFTFRGKSPE